MPRLIRERTRASRGVLASILAAIVVSTTLLCGLSAVADLQLRAAVRAAVPDADVPEGWLQLQTRPAADAAVQDAAADALFDEVLGDTAVVERLELGDPGTDFERVAWRITPDPDRLGPDSIERLAAGLDRLPTAFRDSDAEERGASVSGGLPAAVAEVAIGTRAATALLPVPLIVLGVLAWFAVLQLARLLGLSRGREAALLRARGLSGRQSAMLAAGESAAVAGAALGWALGLVLVPALPGGAGGLPAVVATWPLALLVVLAATATLAVGQLRAAGRARGSDAAAGRVARAATPAAGILLVVVTGVVIWQARTSPSGVWGIVVATLAPALGVAAVALLAVLLFGPVAAFAAMLAGRARGISPSYPARQVARRVGAYSVAVALVAIAVCGAVLAGGYAGMAGTTAADSQRVQAGTAMRAVLPVGAGDVARAESVDGVELAAPAIVVPVASSGEDAVLLALPADAMRDLLFEVPGAAAPATLADAVGAPSSLVAISGSELRLDASARSSVPEAIADTAVRAWIVDDAGTTVPLALEVETGDDATGDTSTFAARAQLPDGAWRLAGLELARGNAWAQVEISFTRFALSADGAPLDVTLPPVVRLYGGFGAPGVPSALVWSAAGEEGDRVPLAITTSLASTLALDVGDPVDLSFSASGRVLGGTVASVSDAIPGIGARPGAVADLEALTVAQLPSAPTIGEPAATPPLPDQLWAAGDEASAPALADELGVPVLVPASQSTAVTAPVTIVWIAAALGGAVLAGVALVALLAAVTRQRAGEVLVLRAIGVAPRRQSRQRVAEAVVVVAIAAALGAAGGYALTALLVPGLVARAVPSAALAPVLSVDGWPVIAAVALIAVGCLAGAVAIAASVAAQSRSTRLEEAAP
ncbi:FtsX-like permease family protein [Microbacterium sp. RU33B]|nr:FtsX-like permease family protein [Microbacterium sp. RU33B]